MVSNPLVSILVPIYHVEDYIERCARSVFEQTYQNLEYVFVDDGTPDASIDILQKVIDDYPNRKDFIRIIRHERNKGLAAARNTAVDASNGKFIFHVDSDDWVELNAVELLVKRQQETGADIVSAQAYYYNDQDIQPSILSSGWNLEKKDLLTGILTYRISTTLWRRLIRKSLYTNNNIRCDERGSGGEDLQVFPRLVYYANILSGINNRIYYYNRSNHYSITNNVNTDMASQKQNLTSVRLIMSFFSDKETFLSDIVAGMDVKNMHYRMRQNVINSNKEGYLLFRNYIRCVNPVDWHYVRWDNPLIRMMENNYCSMKVLMMYRMMKDRMRNCVLKPLMNIREGNYD